MLPSGYENLTPTECILLLQDLWGRIASDPATVPVSEAAKAELDRRLDAHNAAPGDTSTWAQVKARVRNRP